MGIHPKGLKNPVRTRRVLRMSMRTKTNFGKSLFVAFLIGTVLFSAISSSAQDLVPVSDITGGSSVFVFRKASSRKFSTTARATRTQAQRIETSKKIKRQYDTIAKVTPHRVTSAVVTPDKVPPTIQKMPKEQASRIFAGVGEYYFDRNELDKSINFFRESVSLDAKNQKAVDGLSETLAAKGHERLISDTPQSAKALFLEALKNNPKNASAYFGLGDLYSDSDQIKDAIASYEKALANDPGLTEIYTPLGILYYQNGDIAKADELLTKALANSSETAETQVFVGVIRSSQNRNDEAMAAFAKAKTLDPSFADAYAHNADVLMRLGKPKEALSDYQKATSLRNNYFEAWRGAGAANTDLRNYAEAINAFKQAIRFKNDSAEIYAALGDVYRLSGKNMEAESSYATARDFMLRVKDYSRDDVAEVYSKIGYVIGAQCESNMKQAMPCRWPSAITALEKAVELGGANTVDFANLGWAYYNAARIDFIAKLDADGKAKLQLAKTNLQKAVAANPAWVQGPLLNLGMTLTDLGDYPGAADALKKVVSKEPWPFALNELGIAYRKQNNFKDAIAQFKKATDKDDSFAAAHFNLGESEFRNGNLGNAKKEYQKLRKLGREDLAGQLMIISNGAVGR